MGCIISHCKGGDDDITVPLIGGSVKCFVCDKWFASIIEYNRHIPTCKMKKTI